MTKTLQIKRLHPEANRLHKKFGSRLLHAVHGAGCIHHARALFVFINPTGKNISAHPNWRGMRAQWLGTKHVWKLFHAVGTLSDKIFRETQHLAPDKWTPVFCQALYADVAKHGAYVTNLAKCTQDTAKPISVATLRSHLPLLLKEISIAQPQNIIMFGNQISSLVLGHSVSVKNYPGAQCEKLSVRGKLYKVFPVHYPVGQGMRNMPRAIGRIKKILSVS